MTKAGVAAYLLIVLDQAERVEALAAVLTRQAWLVQRFSEMGVHWICVTRLVVELGAGQRRTQIEQT